ncbi:hypothetical protein ACLMJK_008785 [Lecanora helva]
MSTREIETRYEEVSAELQRVVGEVERKRQEVEAEMEKRRMEREMERRVWGKLRGMSGGGGLGRRIGLEGWWYVELGFENGRVMAWYIPQQGYGYISLRRSSVVGLARLEWEVQQKGKVYVEADTDVRFHKYRFVTSPAKLDCGSL